jgi:hypothetical protein
MRRPVKEAIVGPLYDLELLISNLAERDSLAETEQA